MKKRDRLHAAIPDGTRLMFIRFDPDQPGTHFTDWKTHHEADGSMLLIADLADGTRITKRIPAEHVQYFIELMAIDHAMCHVIAERIARYAKEMPAREKASTS
ncbi:MAG: hypothetical protein QM753_11900 [Thermomicrobiales bacterium]